MSHQNSDETDKTELNAATDDVVVFVIDDDAVLEATMATMQGDAK